MNLNGPQSERDSLWSGKIDGKRSDLTKRPDHDSKIYENELNRLRVENKSLRNQLQRALKELKDFQIKYPSAFVSSAKLHASADDENIPPWTTAPEVMSPLLEAYDARIGELEEIVRLQNDRLAEFKENVELLDSENNELRTTQFDRAWKFVDNNGPNSGLGPSNPFQAELVAELNERVDLLMDENALLVEQKALLSADLENSQIELERKIAEIGNNTGVINNLQSEIQNLTQRLSQAEHDREDAANQALQCSDSLGKAETDIEALNEQLVAVKSKQRESENVATELKKQLRLFADRTENDNISVLRRVKQADERARELQALLAQKQHELEVTQEQLRKLRMEYQTTRRDAEGMMAVMAGLERQLNEYAAREDEIEKLSRESKEKIEEALSIREQSVVKEEQNRKEIERLMQERKMIALQRKDELERAADQARKALLEQVATFERELEDIAQRNAKLAFEAEKATRENKSTQDALEKLHRLHDEAARATSSMLKDLADQLSHANVVREQEFAKRVDAQEQNKELRNNIEKLRSQVETMKTNSLQSERSLEKEVIELRAFLRDLQQDVQEKQRTLARRTKELEDVRSSMHVQLSSLERKYTEETALFKRRAAEADRFARDLEAAGLTEELRTQTLVEQLKDKYVATVAQLETKLREESDRVKSLTTRVRNSEVLVNELVEEKARVVRVVEDAKAVVREQEEELSSCRNTINELTGQLTASHSAREEGANRAARTMEEMNVGVRYSVEANKVEDSDGELFAKDAITSY